MRNAIILWVAACTLAITVIAIFASTDVASVLIKAIAVVMVVFPLVGLHASKQVDRFENDKKNRTVSVKKTPSIRKNRGKRAFTENKNFSEKYSQKRVFEEEGVPA